MFLSDQQHETLAGQVSNKLLVLYLLSLPTSSSAITKRPHCRVGQFWEKVKRIILQTI